MCTVYVLCLNMCVLALFIVLDCEGRNAVWIPSQHQRGVHVLVLQNKDFTVLREGLEGLFGNPSLHNLLRGECMRIIQPLRSGNSWLMHFVCLNRM